jgi:polyisoprenoid-binding protein YceI
MRKYGARLTVAALFAAQGILAGEPAKAGRQFQIDDAWGRDIVEFRTSAPLEEIAGTNNHVTGVLRADPDHLRNGAASARIEILLSSFKTGIEMRDGHVAKALGAEKHPKAVFVLGDIATASKETLEPNVAVDITGSGMLELNGIRRTIPYSARLTYVPAGGPFSQMRPGNFVKLVAHFDVSLDDFAVERKGPVLELQVGPSAHVTVTALASDASPEEAARYRRSAANYLGKVLN